MHTRYDIQCSFFINRPSHVRKTKSRLVIPMQVKTMAADLFLLGHLAPARIHSLKTFSIHLRVSLHLVDSRPTWIYPYFMYCLIML